MNREDAKVRDDKESEVDAVHMREKSKRSEKGKRVYWVRVRDKLRGQPE